jgi:hypothetical protein
VGTYNKATFIGNNCEHGRGLTVLLKTQVQGIDLGESALIIAGVLVLLVLSWFFLVRATPKK